MGTLIEGLTVGSDVLYVLESGRCQGDIRPAKVVRIFEAGRATGMVNMQVSTDGYNDGFNESHLIHVSTQFGEHETTLTLTQNSIWRTSVHYSENKEPGTWHWPEKV